MVDSNKLEYGCRMIPEGFLLSLVWGWRTVIFQLSGFLCKHWESRISYKWSYQDLQLPKPSLFCRLPINSVQSSRIGTYNKEDGFSWSMVG